MKPTSIIQRLVILLITLMSAISANAAEAYACYTSSNTTLTFYYDNYRNSHTNTYSLNTGNVEPGWLSSNVTKVVFESSFAGARPKTTFSWFSGMTNLEYIEGMSYLNTSEVTDMRWMFYNCSTLTSLDLSHFNTSVVDYMSRMFSGCSNLTILDLSSFNTSLVDDMSNMFYECRNLQTIYVGSGWNVDGVISSGGMFFRCYKLVGGQGTTYKSSNPTDKAYAHIDGGTSNPGYFSRPPEAYACYTSSNATLTFYFDNHRSNREGTTYDLNTGDTQPEWISINSSLTEVVFDSSFAGARPTTTYAWFYEMRQLQSIEGLKYLNTSEVTNMESMFYFCMNLPSLDISNFDTDKVKNMRWLFASCSNLHTIYVGYDWSTTNAIETYYMFSDCTSLVGGKGTKYNDSNPDDNTYAHIDGGTSNPGYFSDPPEAYVCYTPENTTLTFYYDNLCSTRNTTYSLNSGNYNPIWVNIGTNADVTKVVFDPSFAEARPTTTHGWFYNMTSLESIEGMSYLNTREVTNMNGMFGYCKKLTSLDLSSFNTVKVSTMENMFSGCTSLRTIYAGSGWSIAAVTNSTNMFYNCTKLKGGTGTSYNSNQVDKTYAHIDGGTSNPGYFTYKKPSGIATDLHQVISDKSQVISDEWYTIDGRKLNGKPAAKGVYIQNGKKAVVK